MTPARPNRFADVCAELPNWRDCVLVRLHEEQQRCGFMRTVRACSRRLSFGLLVSRSASLACARSWSGGTAEQLGSHGIRPVSGPKIAGCSGTDRCRERVLDHRCAMTSSWDGSSPSSSLDSGLWGEGSLGPDLKWIVVLGVLGLVEVVLALVGGVAMNSAAALAGLVGAPLFLGLFRASEATRRSGGRYVDWRIPASRLAASLTGFCWFFALWNVFFVAKEWSR